MHYSAFISYNHRDVAHAQRLLRTLEGWRVPPRLRGMATPWGPLGPRLAPLFRDRDELATSADLAESVRVALAESASLIVVCSPHAARSNWVNLEIRAFRAMGRGSAIQCLVVGGVPGAGAAGADPAEEAWPPALLEDGGAEPLAADVRPGKDGWADARTKLVAGILGLRLDDLRQREAQRRQKRLMAVAAGSGVGFVLMSGLAGFALVSRAEAVRQRDIAREKTATAERTVDFVKSLFTISDPSEAMGRTVTAREILDAGARRIETELADEPTVKAELSTTLAEVHAGLGLWREGERILDGAMGLTGLPAETRARQQAARGEARARQGNYAAAIAAFTKGLELAPEDAGALRARLLAGRGEARSARDDFTRAEADIAAALEIELARVGEGHPDVARVLEARALNAFFAREDEVARAALEAALPVRLAQGPLHPKVSEALNMLGAIAYRQQNTEAAESYLRRSLELDRKVLGAEHPDVAMTANLLARILLERRQFAEAQAILADAVRVSLQARPATHDDMAWLFSNLALAEQGLGRADTAEVLQNRALVAAEAHKHRNTGPILVDLADLACARAARAEGQAMIQRALPLLVADWPDETWRPAWARVIGARCAGREPDAADVAAVRARWPAGTLYAERIMPNAR